MYTILITQDNELLATQKTAIMQRSTMVDKLQFLVPIDYYDEDMSTYDTVVMEYVTPISHTYETEDLKLSDDLYKDHLKYILPIDTKITAESGEIELQLSFIKLEMDADTGNPVEHVRKTQPYKLNIIPIANWSQYIADENLTPLDSRILQIMSTQKELTEIYNQTIENNTSHK